ncbi:helix-turn-helix transcriptional regulator [Nocardia beijingensis]|uniref:helix-turn-helix domain-containing protein n=1 Tax=Nocardia beijingensis TaxID=95162 RepID=UPI002B4AB4DD|nr:helix-turn-helix transcriptional regulator [Nocardia beijingensis]
MIVSQSISVTDPSIASVVASIRITSTDRIGACDRSRQTPLPIPGHLRLTGSHGRTTDHRCRARADHSSLRHAREKNGVGPADLARATGISTGTLSRLESAQRKPSLELLLPITAALGIPLDEIVRAPRILDPRVP